ncbi:MAG TPA: ABC transporter ATP-binding protein [Caulobacteraceae bacterium]|nr:ABC transporter ATP-binding protein [Caulobacteraceae bacterium]
MGQAEAFPSAPALAWRVARTYLARRWGAVAAGVACAVLAAAFTGLLAKLIQPAIDQLLKGHADTAALETLPAILAVLAVARGVAQIAQSMLANRIGQGVVSDVQTELVGKLMRADLARLRATHTGGFISQVLNDAGMIRDAAAAGILNYVQQSLTIAAMLAVMLSMDWVLTGLVLLVGPIVGWVLRDYSRRTTRAARGVMDGNASLMTTILESLDGVRVVKMEGREDFERDRAAAAIALRQRHVIAGGDAKATAAPVSEILSMLMVAGVFAYADWRVHMAPTHLGPLAVEPLTAGGLAAFIVALMAAGQYLRQFASSQTTMAEGLEAARRVFSTLDVAPTIADAPGAAILAPGAGTVRLDDVSFSYDGEAPVLGALTLEARRGEIVALVGPSGAGKTTVLNLIARFYDVSGGTVSIDGQDVRGVTLASLRAQIALVTQEPFLFDDSIAANIAYGRAGASRAEIEAAARAAAAHDFIRALPRGYDTQVGEAGARLSGGQRQRIAIARAFLKDAPILLLDEATSALDTESEAQVQAALERLIAGRTTILIAHRLSTVRGADRIYVVDAGQVVEIGAHAELIGAGGLYARLAGTQNLEAESAA